MSAEAYSVAVRLSLTNMVSSGLKIIAADLLGLEKNVGRVEEKLKALKMIGVGWGISKAGDGMLGMISKSVDASKEYTHQVAQMNILGMKQTEIADVISAAWKTSRDVITSSAADNIEAYRELRAVFGAGHEHEALAVLPIAQRSSAILASLTGKMQSVKDIGYDISKAAELTTIGGMTDAQLEKRAEQFTKAQIAFGGKITAQDFHGALKMTRGASMTYNDDFIAHYLPTLIQEMKTGHAGGQSAGVLLRNFDRAVVGQVIPLNKLQTWMDAGLVKTSSVAWNKQHTGLKRINPGGVVGQDLASANPRDWWQLYGEAAIAKLMKSRGLTDIQAISALGTNQMTTDFFKKMHFQKVQFDRDKALIEQAGSSQDSYNKLLKTDPVLAHKALDKQWDNVLARIGYTILPVLLPYMVKFADWLDGIAQWMQHHPEKLKALVVGFLGLGAAMSLAGKALMTLGVIKLLGIGPMLTAPFKMGAQLFKGILGGLGKALLLAGRALLMNPIGLTITAIAVAAYLLWKNWDVVKPKLIATWNWITDAAGKLWDGVKKGFNTFVGWYLAAWQGLFNALISGVNKILPTSMQVQRLSFADDFKNSNRAVAPVPTRDYSRDPFIVQMNMDSKKVGEIIVGQMARQAARPQTSAQGFDLMRSPIMPGTSSTVVPRG